VKRLRATLGLGVSLALLALLVAGALAPAAVAHDASDFASPAFQRVWERTDEPVETGAVNRTWMWGPSLTGGEHERYDQSPDGMRLVQYFDKSRMEITHPDAVDDGVWYVTNGLLVRELITGEMQVGDAQFVPMAPAEVNVAGDPDGTTGPTYASLAGLLDAAPAADGATLTQRVDSDGHVSDDPSLADMNVTAAEHVQVPNLDHQVASVFWTFMNSTGTVYENGANTTAALFQNPFYATGYPVTEAYWATVPVGGTSKTVLLQCFERRCLTFTPDNPSGWQVEAGNVGQHYHMWRYGAGVFSAQLSGAQETPAVDSAATGSAVFFVGEDGNSLSYQLSVNNLTDAMAAHIHLGQPGEAGDIVAPLFMGGPVTLNGTLATGTITDRDLVGPLEGSTVKDLIREILNGNAYVNVHTMAHASGEIRGQIAISPTATLRAALSGAGEDPSVDTSATGYAVFTISDDGQSLEFELGVEGAENVVAAHIHLGQPGEDGPVIVPLFSGGPTSDDGILAMGTLTSADFVNDLEGSSMADLLTEMLSGNTYVNVHTTQNPMGEIRGQVLLTP
jgi:hypothetical protein